MLCWLQIGRIDAEYAQPFGQAFGPSPFSIGALSFCIGLVSIARSTNKDTSTVDPDATATTISPTTDPDAPGMYDKQEDEKPKDQRTLQTEACEGGKGDICTSVGVMGPVNTCFSNPAFHPCSRMW